MKSSNQIHLSAINSLAADDAPSRTLNLLSFLFPLLGLFIYLMLVGKLSTQAASALRWTTKGLMAWAAVASIVVLFLFVMWLTDDICNLW
jgi:hypothetical protein